MTETVPEDIQLGHLPDIELFLIKAPKEVVEHFLLAYASVTRRNWEQSRGLRDMLFPDLNICYGRDLIGERRRSHGPERIAFNGAEPFCVCTQMSVIRSNNDFILIENNPTCYPIFHHAMMQLASQYLKTLVILIKSSSQMEETDETGLEQFANRLDVYDWSGSDIEKADIFDNSRRRVVDIWREDRWRFLQQGAPVFFEKASYYRRKRVVDRLNRSVLCEYLDKLGVDPEGTLVGRELDEVAVVTSHQIGEPLELATHEIAMLDKFRSG